MRILLVPNISNPDFIEADSGIYFCSRLVEMEDYEFIVLSPPEAARVLTPRKGHVIPFSFGNSKYAVRFNFPWTEYLAVLKKTKPDIVFLNQPELVAAFMALLKSTGIRPKIVTYVHYFPLFEDGTIDESLNDNDLGRVILDMVLHGIRLSHVALVQSRYAVSLVARVDPDAARKLMILPPPVDYHIIHKRRKIKQNGKPLLLVNQRFYRHYGIETLLRYLDRARECIDFKVIFTDVLGERNKIRRQLDPYPERVKELISQREYARVMGPLSRKEYLSLIMASTVGVAPPRKGFVWSISLMEIMAAGIPVIGPERSFLSSLIDEKYLYHDSKSFLAALENALHSSGDTFQKIAEKHSVAIFQERIRKILD